VRTILYIGGFILPDRNAAAQRVLNNARIFRSLGYRVVLIGVNPDRPYDRTLYHADAGDAGLEAWETGYPAGQRQWFDMVRAVWPVTWLVEQGALAPADVAAVICYNHPAIAQRRIARLARSWGAKAIADCTEWYAERAWNGPANIVKNLDVLLRMHRVNPRMDGIITISPFLTDHYRGAGVPVVEIPTLIEAAEAPAAAPDPQIAPMALVAVASGFQPGVTADQIHDRIDWIIELLAEVEQRGGQFKLTVAGVDAEGFLSVFPALRPRLEQLGERVVFAGRVPRREILRLYDQAAFSFVQRKETRVTLAGFPTKYSESVTHGTPVIINALPSVRAYHVEGRMGITIDPQDRDDAVRKLCDILTMEAQAIVAMKQYCRECGVFTPSAFAAPAAAFLSAVIGKGGACPSIE
jgi:glycosyltransferase involved in cell wall biosynthesis